jgi:hypothetical protein
MTKPDFLGGHFLELVAFDHAQTKAQVIAIT